ncbi:MAG: cupredoxin domain-containing protein [Nitrososphaerales archaeon]
MTNRPYRGISSALYVVVGVVIVIVIGAAIGLAGVGIFNLSGGTSTTSISTTTGTNTSVSTTPTTSTTQSTSPTSTGATSSSQTSSSGTGSSAASVKVTMPSGVGSSQSLNFLPANITVVIGVNNTVIWTNNDTTVHTVQSKSVPNGASSFDSKDMNAGAVFNMTFTVAGTYHYFCKYHSWMQGTVNVVAKP